MYITNKLSMFALIFVLIFSCNSTYAKYRYKTGTLYLTCSILIRSLICHTGTKIYLEIIILNNGLKISSASCSESCILNLQEDSSLQIRVGEIISFKKCKCPEFEDFFWQGIKWHSQYIHPTIMVRNLRPMKIKLNMLVY